MSAPTFIAGAKRRTDAPRGLFKARPGLNDPSAPLFGLVTAIAAVGASYELVDGNGRLAAAFSLVPIAIWLLSNPMIPLVLIGVTLPFAIFSLSGSTEQNSSGLKFGASDLLLALVAAGVVLEWTAAKPTPVVRALKPISTPIVQYAAVMLVLFSVHHGVHDLIKTTQRFELFLVPVLVGAYAALNGWHMRVLRAYILACTLLALVFPFDNLNMQHNPVGQFVGNAILLLIAVRPLRRLYPCLFILVPSLLLIQSRGAVLATALGVAVVLSFRFSDSRRVMKRALPILLLAIAAFALAPPAVQQRLTTVSAGSDSQPQRPGQFAITLRQQYSKDAHRIIGAHPLVGVGIGNYFAGDSKVTATPVLDPHDVLLLQAAEGGYPLAASFVLLIVGSLFALRRLRHIDVATAAAGVLIATTTHGLADVYWVRGTPVLGWLLVGMTCGGLERLRSGRTAEPLTIQS